MSNASKSQVPGEPPIRPCDEMKKGQKTATTTAKFPLALHIELHFIPINVYVLVMVNIEASRMYLVCSIIEI